MNNARHKSGENHPNWVDGCSGYREKALAHYGEQCECSDCDNQNALMEMLDVHHLDGDRSNNQIENLVVLCVWCHALVTRGLNTIDNMVTRCSAVGARLLWEQEVAGSTPATETKISRYKVDAGPGILFIREP